MNLVLHLQCGDVLNENFSDKIISDLENEEIDGLAFV